MTETPKPLILYVDDSDGNRLVFEQTFNAHFNVRVADSGAEALKILDHEEVAVLITDQRMPEMSGNELLEKARQTHPEVVRMVITAYSDLDPIIRAVNDGLVARYVVKPWEREQVERMLNWGIQTYSIGGQNAETQLRLLELQRLATLGSVYASMIHDVKQPLSYVQGNMQLVVGATKACGALRDLVTLHGEELKPEDRTNMLWLANELPSVASDVTQGCFLISEMISGVRRLLKPVSTGEKASSNPRLAVRFALSACRRPIMATGADMDLQEPPELPALALSTAELAQVLINLLSNAAQAMTRRASRGGRVQFRTVDAGDFVEFIVKDDGPGMPPDVLIKAGTPFFTTRTEGTGLGLSQCRRLVEGAGGKLTISSVEGTGTTVTVTVKKAA